VPFPFAKIERLFCSGNLTRTRSGRARLQSCRIDARHAASAAEARSSCPDGVLQRYIPMLLQRILIPFGLQHGQSLN
jgi:hypothetical protein